MATGQHPAQHTAILSVLAAFPRRYYDYSAFAPDQQSFNDQSGASIMIFWVLVIILVVIAQNVILAIVSDAYGQAREDLQVRGCCWCVGREGLGWWRQLEGGMAPCRPGGMPAAAWSNLTCAQTRCVLKTCHLEV